MPVGTQGAVQAPMTTGAGAPPPAPEVVLANTYHLALRPGEALVEPSSAASTPSCAGTDRC